MRFSMKRSYSLLPANKGEVPIAEIFARKSDKDCQTAHKQTAGELTKATRRLEMIPKLLKKIYEDNVGGKDSDENYMDQSIQLSGRCTCFS